MSGHEGGLPQAGTPDTDVPGLITGYYGDTSEKLAVPAGLADLPASNGSNAKPIAEMGQRELEAAIEVGELFVRLAQLHLHKLHERLGNIADNS
jgi:hypothetical protein